MAAAREDLLRPLGIAFVLLLVAAGCGSTPGGSDDEAADTSRFELVITRTDRDGRLLIRGSHDYARRQGFETASLVGTEAAETDIPTNVRFFGDRQYAEEEFKGRTYWVVHEDEHGTGYPTEAIVPFPGSELDPREALELILAAGAEEERGANDVRGVATTHYHVRIDPKDLRRELGGRPLDLAGGPFVVDVWADDAARVRRIRLIEEDVATLTYEFFDFGVDVDVERPPAASVVTEAEFDKLTAPTEEEELELCMEELPKDECDRMYGERK